MNTTNSDAGGVEIRAERQKGVGVMFKRGQAVRLVDGADAKLRGEIGVVLGVCRDGGSRAHPAKPYVVVGWRRGLGASAYAPADLVAAADKADRPRCVA